MKRTHSSRVSRYLSGHFQPKHQVSNVLLGCYLLRVCASPEFHTASVLSAATCRTVYKWTLSRAGGTTDASQRHAVGEDLDTSALDEAPGLLLKVTLVSEPTNKPAHYPPAQPGFTSTLHQHHAGQLNLNSLQHLSAAERLTTTHTTKKPQRTVSQSGSSALKTKLMLSRNKNFGVFPHLG